MQTKLSFDNIFDAGMIVLFVVLVFEICTIIIHDMTWDTFLFMKYFIPNAIVCVLAFVIGYYRGKGNDTPTNDGL